MPSSSLAPETDSPSDLPAPDTATPHVTVVVLNWCNEEVTRECLESVEALEYGPYTTLLVDNGSPDGSGERLRAAFPAVRYLQTGANQGYTGGNNRGIEWAMERGSDYVLIVNNDAALAPDALSHLVSAAEESHDGPVGGVAPKILYRDDPRRIWYAGGEFSAFRGLGLHWREGELDAPDGDEGLRDVTFMTGCCFLLSAEALRTVGTFDEAFFAYVEDADLSLRLQKAGFRLVYQPRARVFHDSLLPGELPSPFQIRQRDRGRRRVMGKHFGMVSRFPFLVRFYLTRAVLFLRYAAAGDGARARAILQGAGWAYPPCSSYQRTNARTPSRNSHDGS